MSLIKQSCFTKNHCERSGIKHHCHTLKQNRKPARIEVGTQFGSTHHLAKMLNIYWQNLFKINKKAFPKPLPSSWIFNLNTIKLSYCCMSNMSSFIKQRNRNILSSSSKSKESSSNCTNKGKRPFSESCLITCII